MTEAGREMPVGRGRGVWGRSLRETPLGVLLIAAMLAFLGAGLAVGGTYLAFTRADAGWAPVLGGLGAGALTLYVAAHLVRRTRWAWHALLLVLAPLLASSVWRLAATPPPPVAPLAEIGVELILFYYLTRPGVRRAFAR